MGDRAPGAAWGGAVQRAAPARPDPTGRSTCLPRRGRPSDHRNRGRRGRRGVARPASARVGEAVAANTQGPPNLEGAESLAGAVNRWTRRASRSDVPGVRTASSLAASHCQGAVDESWRALTMPSAGCAPRRSRAARHSALVGELKLNGQQWAAARPKRPGASLQRADSQLSISPHTRGFPPYAPARSRTWIHRLGGGCLIRWTTRAWPRTAPGGPSKATGAAGAR